MSVRSNMVISLIKPRLGFFPFIIQFISMKLAKMRVIVMSVYKCYHNNRMSSMSIINNNEHVQKHATTNMHTYCEREKL